MPIQIQEAHITSNRQDQKRKFPQHIIVKILSMHNKESVLKVVRGKTQATYKNKTHRGNSGFLN